jgi:hypothetical protein
MSRFLRRANREETIRYTTPDGEDYVELRAELSKGEVNSILSNAPSGNQDIEGGLAFLELFFERAVVAWSAQDDDGNPILPTVQEYQALEAGAARWLDETLSTHLQEIIGKQVDEAEGKPSA